MKLRLGAYVSMLVGLSALVAACGGGGGGGGATPISVTSSKNPVLYTKNAVITANFSNYTSTVKFGSPVKFTITSPGKLLTPGGLPIFANATTAFTQAGGIATISITCPLPTPTTTTATPVTVTASSANFAGSTTVTYMHLPATATVTITPEQAINKLGALSFNVNNDPVPITLTGFKNLSTVGTNLFAVNPSALPANNITQLTAAILSTSGFNVTTSSILFKFFYSIPAASTDIPNFAVYSSTITAAFANTSSIKPRPKLLVSPVYFDNNGKQMFP